MTTAALRPRTAARLAWLHLIALAGATAAGLALVGIVAFLIQGLNSGPVAWSDLLTSAVWDPASGRFGAAAMEWGTAVVAALALALAAPLGWAAAVAVAEVAPRRWRAALRAGCELLAVVPSIVYGLVGIAYLRPLVARIAGVPGGDSLLTAALVLAVMVLPTIIAVSIDALEGVPAQVREAAAACGLTRGQVIRAAVLPLARPGLRAAALLALARALGETVAVFLLVGRSDGRLPAAASDVWGLLVRPGQTLTTKLNGPEPLLAGTAGAHWAALCALGVLLLAVVAGLTWAGQLRARDSAPAGRRAARRSGPRVMLRSAARCILGFGARFILGFGAARSPDQRRPVTPQQHLPALRSSRTRRARDRAVRGLLLAVLAVPLVLVAGIGVAVAVKGRTALDPRFWWTPAEGASGGGVRSQVAGTGLLAAGAGLLAAPVGLGLGLVVAEYTSEACARWLRTLTLTLGGVPSILLGLWGYQLFSTTFGWGKSWVAGSVVLAVVVVPAVVLAVAAAAGSLPPERREAALAAGLRRDQLVRRVVLPQAWPGLVTGLLLGLARAVGETAPLLFTATVFTGGDRLFPDGLRQAPVTALPTHIFALAQDAAEPAARQAAWGSAFALILVAGLLVLAAAGARQRSAPRRT